MWSQMQEVGGGTERVRKAGTDFRFRCRGHGWLADRSAQEVRRSSFIAVNLSPCSSRRCAPQEWLLVLAELLGVPVRTMGMLAEAGQQQLLRAQQQREGAAVPQLGGVLGTILNPVLSPVGRRLALTRGPGAL